MTDLTSRVGEPERRMMFYTPRNLQAAIKKSLIGLTVFTIVAFASASNASSIKQLHMVDVIDAAEMVFEGQVVASESRILPGTNRIRTWITFSVSEFIKGSSQSSSSQSNLLVLGFAGGQVGAVEQRYEGLKYPQIGERGIYFVESVSKPLVNPLVGWAQGHFKSVYSDGEYKIVTAELEPIAEVNFSRKQANNNQPYLSRGRAEGIELDSQRTQSLTKDQFVSQLKEYLATKQQDGQSLELD